MNLSFRTDARRLNEITITHRLNLITLKNSSLLDNNNPTDYSQSNRLHCWNDFSFWFGICIATQRPLCTGDKLCVCIENSCVVRLVSVNDIEGCLIIMAHIWIRTSISHSMCRNWITTIVFACYSVSIVIQIVSPRLTHWYMWLTYKMKPLHRWNRSVGQSSRIILLLVLLKIQFGCL